MGIRVNILEVRHWIHGIKLVQAICFRLVFSAMTAQISSGCTIRREQSSASSLSLKGFLAQFKIESIDPIRVPSTPGQCGIFHVPVVNTYGLRTAQYSTRCEASILRDSTFINSI